MAWGTASRVEVAQFFNQMAVLVRAGISLERALAICGSHEHSPELRRAISRLSDELRHGVTPADAVALVGHPFSSLHASTLRANQTGEGDFSRAFANLSRWEEKDHHVQARTRSILTYPAFLITLSAIGMALLIRFLVPLMASVAAQLNRPLPMPTRVLLAIGQALGNPVHLAGMALALIVVVLGLRHLFRTRSWQRAWGRWRLRLPLVGPLLRKALLIRLSRVVQSLLDSGLPLTLTLDLAGPATGNPYVAEAMARVSEGVMAGETLSQALRGTGVFPSTYVGMVSVGESTGRLPSLLARLADLYELELDTEINALLRAAEPILVAAVGFVVFLVMAAAFLPMYELIATAGPE